MLFAAIAASGVALSAAISAEACPRRGLYSNGSSMAPADQNRTDGAVNSTDTVKPDKQTLNSLGGNWTGLYGIGAVAGLLAIGIVYKIRSDRRAAATDEIWLIHPELEHPELLITSVPREALSNLATDRDTVMSR